MVAEIKKSYPLAQQYLEKVYVLFPTHSQASPSLHVMYEWKLMNRREIFEESDTDHDNNLSLNEVVAAFQKLQSKITSYPAVRPRPFPIFILLPPVTTPPPVNIHLPSV
jgi:hypothetical protein